MTGPRLLAAGSDERVALARALIAFAEEIGVSSLHLLFPSDTDMREGARPASWSAKACSSIGAMPAMPISTPSWPR